MNCSPETFDATLPDATRLSYALLDINNLRTSLSRAYSEMEMWRNRVNLAPSEADITDLRQELAAAWALLEETQSHRTDERGFVRWYSLWCSRVDAALAEGKK